MTLQQVKKLNPGDTFRNNGRANRRYEVVAIDREAVQVTDEHGYSAILRFTPAYMLPETRAFFATCEAIKIQQ